FQVFSILLATCYANNEPESYSFYRFSGPVSGKVQEIQVPSQYKGVAVDYVAKPDYSYNYEVQDPAIGNQQKRKESRDGDAVQGEYSFLQADGVTRVVRYVADPVNGFKATVEYV
ncbi:cuticle protein 21-like, partial [Agrilus planipennis]|uniref:Cuticle protein 21-like n=1 Tax=Agrilus planipennis TaxID=224129 RepID=A0A1W4WE85_AGRPL